MKKKKAKGRRTKQCQHSLPTQKKVRVIRTKKFQLSLQRLSARSQNVVLSKIAFLADNPRHPSLQSHRHQNAGYQMWECYISGTLRLIYQYEKGILRLYQVGEHVIVERAHM